MSKRVTKTQIAWLAGLLEGEGSFTTNGKKYPIILLNMTDKDVMIRAANLFGNGKVLGPYSSVRRSRSFNAEKPLPMWQCYAIGNAAWIWMKRVLPYLGERRSRRVRELLAMCEELGQRQMTRAIGRRIVCGHLGRKAVGHGLCNRCYQREWARRRRGVPTSRHRIFRSYNVTMKRRTA